MAADEGFDPAGSERRGHAERLAVCRLEAALIEQARVGDAYALSVSTSAEQSCYLRLQAASLQVSRCDRAVKTISPDGGSGQSMPVLNSSSP
jgi:hypothetical protein